MSMYSKERCLREDYAGQAFADGGPDPQREQEQEARRVASVAREAAEASVAAEVERLSRL